MSTLWYRVGIVSPDSNTIAWGDSHPYDTAFAGSVAYYDNTAVEVHITDRPASWYRVGIVSPDSKIIAWGDSHQYDNGNLPRVALYGNIAVEVHWGDQSDLWYRVGIVSPDSRIISWTDSHHYDNGYDASVALYGNTVVEVHVSGHSDSVCDDSDLWYRVGIVSPDSKIISWADGHHYDNGYNPSVALYGNTAVEVHIGGQSHSGVCNEYALWYRVGIVSPDSKIIFWGDSHHYDEGCFPSVGLYGDIAVEVHPAATGRADTLYSRAGTVDQNAKTIEWGTSQPYDNGGLPSITSSTNGRVIEIHEAQ